MDNGNPSNPQQPSVTLQTDHEDVVHDTQWDFYGRYLATCSSDRTIRIFTVGTAPGEKPQLEAILTGHEGPVWMVSWAHPRFGSVLASCSYDRRAIVWKGTNGAWKPIHFVSHKGSVNAVQFAPSEYGLLLATASADGHVAIVCYEAGNWREAVQIGSTAHPLGAMSVSFAPYHPTFRKDAPVLASGGSDSKVRVWGLQSGAGSWSQVVEFGEHKDWVRDVAFSPDNSSRFLTLASCGQDKQVVIRRMPQESNLADKPLWEVSVTPLAETCWRLSWSPCGTMLLVTTADSQAFLLKQGATFTDEWIPMPIEGQ